MESTTFKLKSEFKPAGDQAQAIEKISSGVVGGKKAQVLLGITGSGKTFTMANVIQKTNRPTLILAHNKTLAAQLFQEFKSFFPDNAVEYFVSYYDYYQPEAYIARTDTYIEKDLAINDRIEKMRLSATRSLIERSDVLIVSSVSCIYGLGTPEFYRQMLIKLEIGKEIRRDNLLLHLVELHYKRSEYDLARATFRARGDVLEIVPAYEDDLAYRIEFFGDEIERLSEIDPLTGKVRERLEQITIYPGSHHVMPEEVRAGAIETIQKELQERIAYFEKENRLIEAQRIKEKTNYDLEMIREMGFCKGIENYSRHFSNRPPGGAPACLIDYFPDDFLFIIDESHQTLPQLHAMYNGDRSRKESLIEFGFRLPSAYDNRPLKFEESYSKFHQVVYVSATPAPWEVNEAQGEIIEQVIRPTGLLDPLIEIRPALGQVDDSLEEIRKETLMGRRILVTTLTKKLSEDLSKYLNDIGVKAKYLHSEIDTLERLHILKALRNGEFDVLVGVNLLREGLDLPEVSLVVILDADKEGFLRSQTALIQTCGRAARNTHGRVILYADRETTAIKNTVSITQKRRAVQKEYNEKHGIIPQSTKRSQGRSLEEIFGFSEKEEKIKKEEHPDIKNLESKIKYFEKEMRKASKELRFEDAGKARDQMRYYQSLEMMKAGGPS